jgi:hypothetical protein
VGIPERTIFVPVDPDGLRATVALGRNRPATIELELSDSLFVADYDGGVRTEVPMTGQGIEMEVSGHPTEASVEWKNGHPRLIWKPKEAGEVSDRFEVLPTGRLALTREISGIGEQRVARFVYSRKVLTGGK